MSKVVILYLIWSDEPKKYLAEALQGVSAQTYPKSELELLVVYNGHKQNEESSLPLIREEVEKMKDVLPHTTILAEEKNLGFTGGNNVGMDWAVANGFDYVFLHNADGYLAPEAITNLVDAMDSNREIGQSQALVLIHPENDLINSAGNKWNYLGVGYCDYFRKKISEQHFEKIKNIGYASGAATMLRVDLIKKYGGLNPDFYLYHEDTEYSWRLKIRGFKIILVSEAVFFHKYEFKKGDIKKFYWMERNRHAVLLLIYKWPTLLLLLPFEIAYNLGLILVSVKAGWWKEFLQVYVYWLSLKNWQIWLVERKKYQKERQLSDREVLKIATPTVDSGDLVVSKNINLLANLAFTIYYKWLRIAVWW